MWMTIHILRMCIVGLLMCISVVLGAVQWGKWRSDVALIAYISSESRFQTAQLTLMDVWHGAKVPLLRLDRYQTQPVWSPDGRTLLFVIGGDYNFVTGRISPTRIVYIDMRHYRARALTNNRRSISESAPDWSVTGNIAYARYDNGNWDVVIMRPNLPKTQLLSQTLSTQGRINTSANEHTPKWSPDGTQLAYLVGGQYYAELWIADEHGNNARPLTDNMRLYERQYAWSPRGTHIIFTAERDGNREIYSVNVANGAFINLSRHQSHDSAPAWSPDGTQIAFISGRNGNPQIFLMSPDGSNLRQITHHDHYPSYVQWSPDGAWLIYVTARTTQPNRLIYLLSPVDGAYRPLTFGKMDDFFPQWQP